MNSETKFQKNRIIRVALCAFLAGALFAAGIGVGYQMTPRTETAEVSGKVSNPAYEYMVGAAAWQMSAEWIVFPNAVYGSSANYAAQYGYEALFDYFDYTDENSEAWELYK